MLRSLWIKFFILLIGVSVVALSSAFLLRELMIRDFREYSEGQREDRVYWVIADLEGTYEKYGEWKGDVISGDAIWAFMMGFETKVLDKEGKVVMSTDMALNVLAPIIQRRIIAASRVSRAEKVRRYIPYPLFLKRKEIGTLEVGFLRPESENIFIARSNRFMVISLLALGGLAIVLSTIFSRKLTGPIKRLDVVARAVSGGKLDNKVAVSGNDEIARLAVSFNTMTKSLETQELLRKKLISNVTHEIRTPLSAMKGELAGMIDGLIENNKAQLRSLYEEVGRIEGIFEGMEELSRAQAGALFLRRREAYLKPLLEGIVKTFERLFLDKGVSLDLQCSETLKIDADPDRLSEIIVNLMSNALKATDRDGIVRMIGSREGNGTCVQVADTGCGIKQDDLPFIFVRFYRSSEGGLGIGLAIVKELVDAHNGTIEVASECGKGTIFTVCIPDQAS
ncbi:MAG: HAMP domain-containing sensor histidine kinase [Nitrospiraceae bacterium]|nr:HAMP domain-containing sensor histidine kinase [Nitrospiraceae bacterium]